MFFLVLLRNLANLDWRYPDMQETAKEVLHTIQTLRSTFLMQIIKSHYYFIQQTINVDDPDVVQLFIYVNIRYRRAQIKNRAFSASYVFVYRKWFVRDETISMEQQTKNKFEIFPPFLPLALSLSLNSWGNFCWINLEIRFHLVQYASILTQICIFNPMVFISSKRIVLFL